MLAQYKTFSSCSIIRLLLQMMIFFFVCNVYQAIYLYCTYIECSVLH